ncbi:MAG TPA: peptidylprolyl isomerase [Candidatus Kapabacteria bacterium]|nr:peptidylprolyl isomerase [Candidatus Kapabacteria bacterium]
MKFITSHLVIIVLTLSAHPFYAQKLHFSSDERTIIELQDRRTGTDKIEKFLSASNVRVARRAAFALANIDDTLTRPALVKHLENEKRPAVIDAIAFALGVLGSNDNVYRALLDKELTSGITDELAVALGRTVPKDQVNDLLARVATAHPSAAGLIIMELGLRKLVTDDECRIIKSLENDSDPNTRWHAIYGLARVTDTAFIAKNTDIIKDYLGDLGSPECRMFAATALGNLHTNESSQILLSASRSETEWRVRVNLFNGLAKQQYFSSGILDVVRKAVLESTKDTPTTIHTAIAALGALDKMLADGKCSSPDSESIREWLAGFSSERNDYDASPQAVRAYAMIPAARFDTNCVSLRSLTAFLTYHDRAITNYTAHALGNYRDTSVMLVLLRRLFSTPIADMPAVLEGLQAQWKRALADSAYWKLLDSAHYTAAYRHMVIRFADQNIEPAIVGMTMQMIQDPRVIVGAFRTEAKEYLSKYLTQFNKQQNIDLLGSVIEAIGVLKFSEPAISDTIRSIYAKAAKEWGNTHLADIAYRTLDSLGIKNVPKLTVVIHRDSIDWDAIEQAPDTVVMPTLCGMVSVKLLTDEAPMTVLNILKLARTFFFANSSFHRVVPNFVAQAGDLSGTGWGGPGYAIRTEIAPTRYDTEGVCGMASDGKDTEGSQWFITHCPTPHLDTRYSIWGKVVKHMDCIENMQLDDQIQNVIPYH